ncbi:MAG: hypothetical protein RJR34_13265 [Candidatus Methanoculleus thermohydrogenotrophicum]|nr:hypothetical protein [Candidatus Methanoculleus thermohydrogenotrophicum]
MEDDRSLDDMILMTFSRSQAADLADRLARSVFPDEDRKDILRRCATVDGMTLRAVRAAGLISDSRSDHRTNGRGCEEGDPGVPSLCRRTGSRIPPGYTPLMTATR